MAQPLSRTGGHGFTVLKWKTEVIANVQQIAHVSPQPVSPPAVIQPINYVRPKEIVSPAAIGHGVLTLQLIELWQEPVWDNLAGISNSQDLADIFALQRGTKDEIYVAQFVLSPDRSQHRTTTFHGCVIADVRNGETIDVTTMQVNKEIDIWYEYSVRSDKDAQVSTRQPSNSAFFNTQADTAL